MNETRRTLQPSEAVVAIGILIPIISVPFLVAPYLPAGESFVMACAWYAFVLFVTFGVIAEDGKQ